jgi:cardiolipin synthase
MGRSTLLHLASLSPHLNQDRIFTVPNALTMLRLCLAPWLGQQVFEGNYDLAAGAFLGAALLDVADGWVARRFQQTSKLGSYLDPLADKVLLACSVLPLAATGVIPAWLVALMLARDGALVAGGLYLRAVTRPPGRSFFDSSDAAVPSVHPSDLSKANTALQLGVVVWALAGSSSLALPPLAGEPFQALCALTAVTTLASGAHYVVSMRAALAGFRAAGGGALGVAAAQAVVRKSASEGPPKAS